MNITPKQFHYGVIASTVLVAGLCLSGVFLGGRILTNEAKHLNDLKLESEVLDRQKQDIVIANAHIKRYEDLEKIAQQVVPQDKDQTRAVREIIALAKKSGITISSITFPSSNLGQKTTGTTKDKTTTTPAITQVKPVTGMKGVYELEIIVKGPDSGTDFRRFTAFLKRLESNQRTSQVSNLDVTPDPSDPSVLTFSMTIKVYVKP